MEEPKNYRMPMPSKMGDRGSTGGAGYTRASITRPGGIAAPREPNIKTGMTLQPPPINEPEFPVEQNGFDADRIIPTDDAQTRQTEQPPLNDSTEPPPVPANTAEPPKSQTSDPTPGPSDPGASGGAAEPGYASMIEETHPRGYPRN